MVLSNVGHDLIIIPFWHFNEALRLPHLQFFNPKVLIHELISVITFESPISPDAQP